MSAHHRECVDRIVAHDEEIDVLARRPFDGGEQPLAERVDVVEDLRVVDEGGIHARLAHELVPDGFLLRLGERRRGDVAEVGQHLRSGRLHRERERQDRKGA
jgi:hypothetical protein